MLLEMHIQFIFQKVDEQAMVALWLGWTCVMSKVLVKILLFLKFFYKINCTCISCSFTHRSQVASIFHMGDASPLAW